MAKKPEKQTLKDLKPQGDLLAGQDKPTDQTPPTTEGQAGGHTEKPEMAAKKDWSQLFAKSIKEDQEVPAVKRTGRTLPFPFDSLKLNAMFNVTKEFWVDHGGLTAKQATDPARNKEAIRRSFYGWRDKDKAKRDKFAIAMSDQFNASKEYTGVNVYLVKAQAKAA